MTGTTPPSVGPEGASAPVINTPLLILLGGSIGVGKTTLARRLAAAVGADCLVGTSILRTISAVIAENSADARPRSLLRVAREHLVAHSPDELNPVMEEFYLQAKPVVRAVEAIATRIKHRGAAAVIEGTHLFPGLYEHLRNNNSVFQFVIAVDNDDEHRRRLMDRHYMGDLESSEQKELVAMARCFQRHYRDAATKVGPHEGTYPLLVIEHSETEVTARTILEFIDQWTLSNE